MGIHKSNIIVLLLLILTFVILIVSFASPWYKSSIRSDDDVISYLQFRYDSITNVTKMNSTVKINWTSKEYMPNSQRIFQLAFSFIVIAWILDVATIFLIGLSMGRLLKRIPPTIPINNILRFLPIGVLISTLLSVFIFLGLPNAIRRDCWFFSNRGLLCRPEEQKEQLVGSLDDGDVSWGPIEGWFCAIISSALALAASCVSVISSRYC